MRKLIELCVFGILFTVLLFFGFSLFVLGPKDVSGKRQLNSVKLGAVEEALNAYFQGNGMYPSNLSDLKRALSSRPSLVTESTLTDVYGRRWVYQPGHDGKSYRLGSLGADGAPGGEDDASDVVKAVVDGSAS